MYDAASDNTSESLGHSTSAPRPHPHVAAVVHGAETVLLHLDFNRYYSMNEVGGRIWALLCSGLPIEDIAEQLSTEFDVTTTDAKIYLHDFLGQLRTASLLS